MEPGAVLRSMTIAVLTAVGRRVAHNIYSKELASREPSADTAVAGGVCVVRSLPLVYLLLSVVQSFVE